MKGTRNPVWNTMVELLVADYTQVCSHFVVKGGLQPISKPCKCIIAAGQTKGANERSFVFVHQHGGDDVT